MKERMLSLDAFRGIAIAAMILVNNPGSSNHVYRGLQHAVWNGCRPADLIFPFFLFIVGVAITLSFARRQGAGGSGARIFVQVLRRTLIIFALGLMLNGFPAFDWSDMRIPGVLQRIAVCYFLASTVVLTLDVRGQAVATALILIGYWAVMKLVPVPGNPAGHLAPGEDLGAYIDNALMPGHLWHHRWDPEGILSTLPATATTLSGALAGHWLRSSRMASQRVSGLLVAGLSCVAAGLVMHQWFPINKTLWTSSYVVFTSGVALGFLGLCYWLIDVEGCRRWATPFVVYGTNPLVAYFLSSLTAKATLLWRVTLHDGTKVHLKRFVFERFFLAVASPLNASLLYAAAYVLLWAGLTAILYRRRIFIKI